jgi:hypothetical protein
MELKKSSIFFNLIPSIEDGASAKIALLSHGFINNMGE